MIRVLLSVLIFLFPLGTYLFILGRLNRRRHPVLVTGVQDCAGLLLALSGFFLFVCPSILTGFHYRPRDIWLYNHYSSLLGLGHRWWVVWWALAWLAYALVVIGGAVLLLRRRRRVTVIYNVEPAAFDQVLGHVLNRLELDWTRNGRHVLVGYRPSSVRGWHSEAVPPEKEAAYRYQDRLLEVEPWSALRHVTLHWAAGSEPSRRAIEEELGAVLAGVWTRGNPAGMWLLSASALVFVLMFFLTVLYQYLSLHGVRVGI